MDIATPERLLPSTYSSGEHAYLLNADPGTYVAVAVIYGVQYEGVDVPVGSASIGSNASVGVSVEMFGGEETYRNYLSMDLIEETKTSVEPHSFAFMGKFSTDQSTTFGEGDEVQSHFLKVLEGKEKAAGAFSDFFGSDHARRLSPHKVERDKEAELAFCEKAKKHLKETAWVALIDEAMAH